MRTILTLLRKDLRCFFKDRGAVAMTFLVPAILIYIFGYVFGLNKSGSPAPQNIAIAIVNQSRDASAADLIQALREEKTFRVIESSKDAQGHEIPLTEEGVRRDMRDNKYRYALVLPEDLLANEGIGLHLKFLSNPRNDIETQMVNGILQKTIFSNVPQLLGQGLRKSAERFVGSEKMSRFNERTADLVSETFQLDRDEVLKAMKQGDYFPGFGTKQHKPNDASLRRLDASATKAKEDKQADDVFSKIVRIENEQVFGKKVKNPAAARLVGGYAIMFLLFAVSGASISLFEEKKSGIIMRLLSTPTTRGQILLSKFLFGVVFGLMQITTLFIVGHLLYDLELSKHFLPLLVVSLCAASACSAFGMFVAAVSRTQSAAHGLNTLLVLTMSAIGGAWFPVSFMPEFIQRISKCTLVYWSVEGFTSVLWAGQGLLEVLPVMSILLAMTGLILILAAWGFRRGPLFD